MQKSLDLLLRFLILLGIVAGLYGAGKRYSSEQHNRRVDLALEYSDVNSLSQLTGQSLATSLLQFRADGVTSISITEDTLATLEAQGAIHTQEWSDPQTVTVNSPEVLERIKKSFILKGLQVHDSPDSPHETVFEAATDQAGEEASDNQAPPGFAVKAEWAVVRTMGVGLDPRSISTAKAAGLKLIARINNFPGASPKSMLAVLKDVKQAGCDTVIFSGLEVFGYRAMAKDAAEAFKESGVQFGQVEFGKQKGDESLAVNLKGDFIRVHSISDGEMGTLDETEAIERFVRAARERNIRLCYIRFITTTGENPIALNAEYISKIAKATARGSEMSFGTAKPFDPVEVPAAVTLLIALGVAAAGVMLLRRILPVSNSLSIGTLACLSLLFGAMVLLLGETGHKLTAFAAALIFPTLACFRRDLLDSSVPTPAPLPMFGAIKNALRDIVTISLVTSIGIVSVVGLLASRPFMMRANQFMGIKAAHAIPVVVIGLLLIMGVPSLTGTLAGVWESYRNRLKSIAAQPLLLGQLLLGLVTLVAFMLILARTGNEPGVGVSGIELKFRSLLDHFLPVRPRTKEFMIGHPIMVFALGLWWRGNRKWAAPLFVVGIIGQVSFLNTFCHIHTPLHLSIIRDVTGLVIGSIIGIIALMLTDRFFRTSAEGSRTVEAA